MSLGTIVSSDVTEQRSNESGDFVSLKLWQIISRAVCAWFKLSLMKLQSLKPQLATTTIYYDIYMKSTIKILIKTHTLANAHPPIWIWKMAFFLQFLEKYQTLINAHC